MPSPRLVPLLLTDGEREALEALACGAASWGGWSLPDRDDLTGGRPRGWHDVRARALLVKGIAVGQCLPPPRP